MTDTADAPAISERRKLANVGMGLSWHASNSPDRLAIVSPHGTRTYAELNARANQFARAIRRRGVTAGESMGLVMGNRPEWIEAIQGALRTGLRTTPINWHLTGEEIAYILNDCGATVVVGDARIADACAEALGLAPGIKAAFCAGGPVDGFEELDVVVAEEDSSDIDDPVVGSTMLYTSGTTGRPKGVYRDRARAAAQEREQATSDAAAMAADPRRAYRDGDVHLLTGPAYHAAPFGQSVMRPMAVGVTLVMMDGWDPEETLRLIERHRVTHTHMVPTMFHRLLALPDATRAAYDVSSIRFVNHGAAPCPVDVKQRMMDWWGPVIYEYYAATEGGGTTVGPDEWLAKPGTVGRARAGQVVEVWGPEGEQCPPGVVGTVYFKAPAARFEYYNDPDKTAGAYNGDYFTLGDMGYFDEDGYLFLTGRSADLIISGGVNIYPVEVDAVLLEHPAVADVATVGVPNDEWGEEVKAVVQLKPEVAPTDALLDELLVFCRERLAHYKCPRSIDVVDRLPREDSGKIFRRKVRDVYWAGRDKKI